MTKKKEEITEKMGIHEEWYKEAKEMTAANAADYCGRRCTLWPQNRGG